MLRCRYPSIDIHRTCHRSAAGGAALVDIRNTDEREIINNEDILNRVRVHRPNFIDILNNYAQNLMDNIQNEHYLPRCLEVGRRNTRRIIIQNVIHNMYDDDGVNDNDYHDEEDDYDDSDNNENDNDNDNGNDEEDNDDDEDEEENDDGEDEDDDDEDEDEDDDDEEEEEDDNDNQRKELVKTISIESVNLFEKVNNIMLPWMRSEDPSVRMEICSILSTMVKDSYCLEKCMENTGCLKELMSMVENDNDDEVRVEALAAITSLVCQNIIVFRQFTALGGKKLIFNSLKSNNDKLKIKAVLIICSTCHLGTDVMVKYSIIEVIKLVHTITMSMERKYVESFHNELLSLLLKQMNHALPGSGQNVHYSTDNLNERVFTLLRASSSSESEYQARYFVNGFLTK